MKRTLSIVVCVLLIISNSACVKNKRADNEVAVPHIEDNQNLVADNEITSEKEQSQKDLDNAKSEQLDIDTDDFVILNPEDYNIGNLFDEAGYVSIRVGEKWGCMNKSGEIVITPQYEYISKFENGIACVIKDGKIGYIKPDGSYLIEPKYDRAGSFVDGITYVGVNIKYNFFNYSIIDVDGNILLDNLDVATSTAKTPDVIIFKKEGKTGAFIRSCKKVISAEYDSISAADNILIFTKDGKQGCMNFQGEVVIPATYKEIWDVKGNTAFFRDENEKIGIINLNGNVTVSARYDVAKRLSNGMIKVKEKIKFGLINSDGKIIIEPRYYSIDDFNEGLCAVRGEYGYGYIDENGNEVIAQKYKDAHVFSEGLAAVKNKDKWGYIDKTGKIVIKEKFENADKFENGNAFVSTDENYYIDKKGKQAYPTVPVKMCSGDYYGILGSKGKPIKNCFYNKIFSIISDRALVFDGEKWGYVNSSGEPIIECNYQWASVFSDDGYAIVRKAGIMYSIIDRNGKQIGDDFLESYLFSTLSICEENDCGNPVIEDTKCYEHIIL